MSLSRKVNRTVRPVSQNTSHHEETKFEKALVNLCLDLLKINPPGDPSAKYGYIAVPSGK